MRILKEISEASLGLSNEPEKLGDSYELRKSARAILLNEQGEIAIQHLRTYTYHKLPGGGLEHGESAEDALKREVLEEVGCQCEVVRPVGVTIEYLNRTKVIHLSYCFVAKVVGEIGEPKLEEGEITEGHETLWMTPVEALAKMKTDIPGEFKGNFILEREKTFLEEFLKS